MSKVLTFSISLILLLFGFALGFSSGRSAGFETGSEWALVQADILAREAGLYMPVYFDQEDNFRIVIKQRRGLYKRAWDLADRYEQARDGVKMADLRTPAEPERAAKGHANF